MPTLLHRLLDRTRWEWREWRSPSAPSFIQEELDHALLNLVPWRPDERVLDVGCAHGRYLRALHERGASPLGLDLDLAALQRAVALGPSVLAASGESLPFADASFDAVLCHKTMYLFPHPDVAAREFARVLRPNGRVVFSTSNHASPYARVSAAAIRAGRHPNWGSANIWSITDWRRAFARLGLRTRAVYSCNLVWPLVFRVGDRWIIPNEWMRRYHRWIRRLTRQPLQTTYPLGAAYDYLVVLQKSPSRSPLTYCVGTLRPT